MTVARSTVAVALALAATLAACGGSEGGPPAGESAAESVPEGVTAVTGDFADPESVLDDSVADVYLVSNVNGQPADKDGNGYISQVSPEGQVLNARWIDGATEGVTLNAPKGMAILGDTLYVADIDCVRMFVRTSGAPAGEVCIRGAEFLNDIGVDKNHVLYVTDTGVQKGQGNDSTKADGGAIYRFSAKGQAPFAKGDELGNPNGIAFGPRGGFVVAMGSGEIYQIQPDGSKKTVLPPREGRQLDGIVFTSDGGFVFSNWADKSVTQVGADGSVRRIIQDVESPADIGYDARRNRVLVPQMMDDRILFKDLETPGSAAPAGGSAGAGG